MIRILLHSILVILFFCVFGIAKKSDTPFIVDEFGKINSEELTARLDNYFYEYERYSDRNPKSRAVIIIQLGKTNTPGFFYRHSTRIKLYLTKVRKIPEDRIIFAQGQTSDYLTIKLYLIPDGLLPEFNDSFESNKKAKTFLFDSFDYTNEDFGTCCIIDNFKREETESTLTALSNLAKTTPESKIYLIAYGCKNCKNYGASKNDSRAYAQNFLKEAKEFLSSRKVENSRIDTNNGGFRKKIRKVEIWFVPKGGEIPKPKPDYFPKKKRKR